mmetsp:Transcript_10066/g.61169  ORF Transcript_10066/g.61169 Transcript_10066/m.61169 type:complete len:89 (-) Transcript_10066:69-335(-)
MVNVYTLLINWVFLNNPSAGLHHEVLSCISMVCIRRTCDALGLVLILRPTCSSLHGQNTFLVHLKLSSSLWNHHLCPSPAFCSELYIS